MIDNENYIWELRKGNDIALEYIVEQYSNLMFQVAFSVLNRREVSKECINDVFLKVWNNIGNFKGGENQFKNWICTITKYTAIDMLRNEVKHSKNVELEDNICNTKDIDEFVEIQEEVKEVINVINSFKEQDRAIFYRRFILGQSTKEVAEGLNIRQNFVGQRITRCRKAIKKVLENESLLVIVFLSLKIFNNLAFI